MVALPSPPRSMVSEALDGTVPLAMAAPPHGNTAVLGVTVTTSGHAGQSDDDVDGADAAAADRRTPARAPTVQRYWDPNQVHTDRTRLLITETRHSSDPLVLKWERLSLFLKKKMSRD